MILFCATEAGGAQELVPVIQEAKNQNLSLWVLSSPVTAPIFDRNGIEHTQQMLGTMEEAETLLQKLKITALVTGTTGVVKSERYLIAAAKEMKIKSVSVLDEWYNYALRFADDSGNPGVYLPDIICVQDELSKKLALAEGLPKDMLKITGSASLSMIAKRARHYGEEPPACPDVLLQQPERVSLLFLSERLREAYGNADGDHGSHGEFLGFHEDMVRDDLASFLAKRPDVFVVEKLHPSERKKKPPTQIKNGHWEIVDGAEPVEPLLWHADVILGMCSKTLLEAAVLGRRPLSYQPHAKQPHKCTAVRLGVAELITNPEALAVLLPDILQKKKVPFPAPASFPFAEEGAAKKVLECAL